MLDIKAEKHRLSQMIDVSENEIDDSIVPLMVLLDGKINNSVIPLTILLDKKSDKAQEEMKNSFNNLKQEVFEGMEKSYNGLAKYEKLLENAIQPIHVNSPSVAFALGAGRSSMYVLAVSIVVGMFELGYMLKDDNKAKAAHADNLAKVITYDQQSGKYYLKANSLEKDKSGNYALKIP